MSYQLVPSQNRRRRDGGGVLREAEAQEVTRVVAGTAHPLSASTVVAAVLAGRPRCTSGIRPPSTNTGTSTSARNSARTCCFCGLGCLDRGYGFQRCFDLSCL